MQSRIRITIFTLLLTAWVASGLGVSNSLTATEQQQGWKLLFDGQTGHGWHAIGKSGFPNTWIVADGWLHCLGKGGGDILSEGTYDQFELTWEWKLEKGGNSGVKYFVDENRGPIGHEYQLLDDDRHPDAKLGNGKRVTASFYDVLKPQVKAPTKQPMEVNQSRILVQGSHVEHWLNGTKVLEYTLGSPAMAQAVAASKFKDVKGFGTRARGHLLLQDHNNLVWFRNIKIREIRE